MFRKKPQQKYPAAEIKSVCDEVVARLRADTGEDYGFYTIFADVAHEHNIYHRVDPKKYNTYFGQAEKAANSALGKPFVQRAKERLHRRPIGASAEQSAALTRRIQGEREEEDLHT